MVIFFKNYLRIGCLLWLLFSFSNMQTACAQGNLWSDSCISSSFVGALDVTMPGQTFSHFRHVHNYINDDIIAVGFIRINISSNMTYKVYGLVMRVTKSGVVKWTKFVGLPDYPYENDTRFYTSVIARNNDIIVVGEQEIVRLDQNGNQVWQQRLPVFSNTGPLYEQIIETEDGGFLLAGPHSYNGVVLKLHSTGLYNWSRVLVMDEYINCRSIIETTGGYYVEGYSYNTYMGYDQNFLLKLNKSNGDTLWSKTLGKANFTTGGTEYAYDWMDYRPGLLTLTGNTNRNYTGSRPNSQSVVTFNEDGTLLNARRIFRPGASLERSSLFRSRLFDVATKTGVQYLDDTGNAIYLHRLDNSDNPVWSWKLPLFFRDRISDIDHQADSSIIMGGVTTLSSAVWSESALLIKTTSVGLLNNCPVDVANISSHLDTIVSASARITAALGSPLFYNSTFQVFDGSGFNFQLLCSSESKCRLGKIQGQDTVCAGTSQLFKITRDGQCINPVQYSLSDTFAGIMPVSDTSVSVRFRAAGRIVLYAKMLTTCGEIKDSIIIYSFSSPGSVDLGPDVSICAGNSLQLKVKAGYTTYLWQNGSTDSVFSVSSAGRYFITVIDACGGIFSDTINVTQEPPIVFDVGADRIKCNIDTVQFAAPAGFLNYTWLPDYKINSVNSSNPVVSPLVDTNYTVRAEKRPGCFVFDTVMVYVINSPKIDLGSDTSFCKGDSIVLQTGSAFNSYVWSTGEIAPSISINQVGKYFVAATFNNGCTSRDTINVVTLFSLPMISLGSDSTLCNSGTRNLSTTGAYANYKWQDGSSTPTYSVSNIGTYWLNVIDNNGCKAGDTITISKLLPPLANFLPADTSLCSYITLELKSKLPFQNYLWSDNSISSKMVVSKPGLYWLQGTDNNNCIGRDSITINPGKCLEGFYVPTAFTPNNDGKNDLFKPLILGDIKKYALVIMNRWGETVFQTTNDKAGWDGLFKGLKQETNTFLWYCRYQFNGMPEKSEKGTVLLIR